MKKLIYIFLFLNSALFFSQKYTLEQIEKSENPKEIAAFLKANPNHPRSDEFKGKLVALIRKDNDPVAKPVVKPLKKEKLARDLNRNVEGVPSSKNKQTARVLTGLFNNDPNKKEVIVQITNKSSCNMIVKFSGKDFYQLDIPAKNLNYVLVKKGNYVLTTAICDAKYSSVKKIERDLSISLDN